MNQYYQKKLQLTGIRWLARHILLASIFVLAGINVAHAVPVLSLPADITTNNDAGLCGANVNYDVTATDDSGNPTVSSNPASGSFFDVGTTQVDATATDLAGNSAEGSFNVTVSDTEPPTVVTQQLEIVLDSNGEFRIPSANFLNDNAFVSRSDNCGMKSRINISGSTLFTCSRLGAQSEDVFSLDVNGNQTRSALAINVTDPLGVCNSAPTITSSGTVSVLENQTSVIDVQATDDNDSEGAGLIFSLSGGADQALFNIDTSTGILTFNTAPDFELPTDTGGDNNYNIEVTATDSGGLTAVQDIVVTVTDVVEDTTPPVLSLPTDITANNDAGLCGANVNYDVAATDDSGNPTVSSNPASGSFFDVGTTQVDATATDLAGNSAEGSFNVTVSDTEPPTVVTQQLEIVLDSNGEFRLSSANFLINNAFVSRSDNCEMKSQVNISGPKTYTCNNLGTSDGATIFSFDVNGNQTRSAITINVTDPLGVCNSAPVLAPIGNQTIDEGQPLEFTVSASDTDTGDTLTFQLGNPPTGATLTNNGDGTATFNWTPDFTQAGRFPDVLFTVNDDGLPVKADMETITIAVGDINLPPQFDDLASQSSDEGVVLNFNVQATDPDGNAITLAASNLPSGAIFSDNGNGNGTFNWTPEFDQAGNFTVMFTATDDGAPMQSDTLDVTIAIGDVNRMPVLSMIGNRAVDEGQLLEFILTASDPDGNNLSYTMDNTPTGATFTDNGDGTATFSWTPGFDQAGNHTDLLFTVTDDGVPTQADSEEITVTVGNVNRPPVLSMIGDRTVTEGELLEIILTGSDPDGDNLNYSIENTPTGAMFNDNGDGTATFSWMPGFGQAGSFPNVLFAVTDNSEVATELITFTVVTILDQINALKTASWNQVSDRPFRITANAPLAQAIQYYNIAAANYRQNKKSAGDRYLRIAISSINRYISILELGIRNNKFPREEVVYLLETAASINVYMQNLIDNPL